MRNIKVGVLTFHRCINYGSYWQARALAEGLKSRGCDAVILDHQCRRTTRAEWRNAFQPTLPQRTPRGDYVGYAAKTRGFLQAFAALPLSQPFPMDDPGAMEPCDAVLVGSDEVWNFSHPWYAAQPLFFGEGLRAKRVVAYAASFGCHDSAAALDEPWAERLRRFSALAVRDDNSRQIVRQTLGAEPALVLDPCLQFPESVRRASALADETDEAVVYGHNFPAALITAVRDWAKARRVRLVSVGYRNDWADVQRLDADPEAFAQAMGAARAVITNFFHGCVFALANARPFVCSGTAYRWHKIASLMDVAQAEDRLVIEGASDPGIHRLLDTPPASEPALGRLRRRSSAYLDHALA
jgi:hypothetical protein